MADVLDMRPKGLDLIGTAGDTMTAKVDFADPDAYDLGTMVWTAKIRADPTATSVLGQFDITPHATGVYMKLSATTSRTLWDLRTNSDQDFYRPTDVDGTGVAEFDPNAYGKQVLPGDTQPWYTNIGLPKTLGENAWVGFYDLQMATADSSMVTTLIRGSLSIVADVFR